MKVDKEILQELHKLVLEQTNDLWLIAAGLIAFQALLIAHLVYSLRAGAPAKRVAVLVSISTVFHVLSLAFGYLAKGALIQNMIDYAATGVWTFGRAAAWINLLQMVSVTVALFIFIVAFALYSALVAKAVVKGARR